ncbi:hypothetical protein Tco_1193319 [Tanacetum coccineum]
MRTRSQARRRRQPQVRQTSVESSNLEKPDNPPIVTDGPIIRIWRALDSKHPTRLRGLRLVIPGYCTANNFEIKHGLLNLVQNKQFFGNDKEDPHAHIRYFNKITSTMKIPNVPNTSVKLMLFPFSLEGAARIWLEKEPPRSIETWDDLLLTSGSGNPFLGNTVTTPKKDLKDGSTENVPTPVVQIQYRNPNLCPMLLLLRGTSVLEAILNSEPPSSQIMNKYMPLRNWPPNLDVTHFREGVTTSCVLIAKDLKDVERELFSRFSSPQASHRLELSDIKIAGGNETTVPRWLLGLFSVIPLTQKIMEKTTFNAIRNICLSSHAFWAIAMLLARSQ